MQGFGQAGLRALEIGTMKHLARIYWYTVEFGLIKRPEGLRIYGAGIVSSFGECQYALEDKAPNRIKFNLERIMRTEYEIDKFQKLILSSIILLSSLMTHSRISDQYMKRF